MLVAHTLNHRVIILLVAAAILLAVLVPVVFIAAVLLLIAPAVLATPRAACGVSDAQSLVLRTLPSSAPLPSAASDLTGPFFISVASCLR